MVDANIEIYLIGISVLAFLILTFFFVKKISNAKDLQVKIEPSIESNNEHNQNSKTEQGSFEFTNPNNNLNDQELVVFNLISIDKSFFDMEQMFGFMNNIDAKFNHGFFSVLKGGNEQFRIANALNPGIFSEETNTFAIIIAADLINVNDPIDTLNSMVDLSYLFADKFHANICDQERTPITKQMISHLENKAQEIARIKSLESYN
jgi:FtsZ-interacting cell division protein ZipA